MARSGPMHLTLEVHGGQRTALVFMRDHRIGGALWALLALGLAAVLVGASVPLDQVELGLGALLVALLALFFLLGWIWGWLAQRLTKGRDFFGLVREGVVIGTALGQEFIPWPSIDTWRITRGESVRETFLELIGPPDGSPERSVARTITQRLAVRVDALSANRPGLAAGLAKALEAFADGSTDASPDEGPHGVVKRLEVDATAYGYGWMACRPQRT